MLAAAPRPKLASMYIATAAYMEFAVSFHLSASVPETARFRRLGMLVLMTLATLTMAAFIECSFGALSLVVLAAQAALFLPPRAARSLLEETSRAHERTRISRELHDVLGHDLTALGLQLEVATHLPPDRASVHVATAQEVTARLLQNVRTVAMNLRDGPTLDLRQSLRALVGGTAPGLVVHLAMPEVLRIADPLRGQCILRCAQEIMTNALRHAGANNLWIRHRDPTGSHRAR
jgi:signal transduction histidine kinase